MFSNKFISKSMNVGQNSKNTRPMYERFVIFFAKDKMGGGNLKVPNNKIFYKIKQTLSYYVNFWYYQY